GTRGIEPRSPARSLFYHALASPNVLNDLAGNRLGYFPTWADLDLVENYVYGVEPPTIDFLLTDTGTDHLTVVVFAYEYRPAGQTPHRKHADMVYARTGIARVGTAVARYVPEMRGFHPELPGQPSKICVSPAKFAAFLAVPMNGDVDVFRPIRFRSKR